MKKILYFMVVLLFLSGCGKYSEDDVIRDFSKNVEKANGYHLTGTLEIYRNEELYTYDVDSAFQSTDNFKVSLINKTNNHEQIILKNSSGVYVLTPSLNKSFKFQSEWPFNNSQIYLLQPLIKDIESDSDRTFEKNNDGYILTVKVKYDNDKHLEKQKIYLDKDLNLVKVEVLDNNGVAQMIFTISEYDLDAKFDDDYFNISDNYQNNFSKINNNNDNKNQDTNDKEQIDSEKNSESTSKIDEIVYPMYVPVNTYLSNQDNIKTDAGERVILTFSGDNPFLLVQETANLNDKTDFIYGDPYLVSSTVGAVTDYSVSWIDKGIEYSVVSDNLDVEELISVAESISTVSVGK